MATQVTCPNPRCGRTWQSSTDMPAGQCPHCGAAWPTAGADAIATVAADAAEHACDTSTSDRPPAAAAPPAADSLRKGIPAQISRFRVQSRLGEGQFGTVYLAYDPQLERRVALKVPRAATLADPKRVRRFLDEAKSAARLRHPHIVPVYDAGHDGARYYIASAYISGASLAEALDKGLRDIRRAARMAQALAEGLHYAHQLGIAHRDVKPANIMVDGEDRPLLMDFGLARRLSSEAEPAAVRHQADSADACPLARAPRTGPPTTTRSSRATGPKR